MDKQFLLDQGYVYPVQLKDGSWACINGFMFTVGILHGLDKSGYHDRWCYHSMSEAVLALATWTETGAREPEGWHRHTPSWRRRDEEGREWVAP